MCIIIELLPGMTIPFFYIENAVNNNEDGYGLVIKHKDRLEIIKECPPLGTNPVDIQNLLEEHKTHLRYLHLRHKTEGEINLANCHPYTCYGEKGVDIQFMHNGTMHEYAPKREIKTNNVITQAADPRSDSQIFVDTILKPLLKALKVPDYTDDFAKKFILKMWPYSGSRGLLISNKYPTMVLGGSEWKTLKIKDINNKELEFRASNDDYFFELKRGRQYDLLLRKREQETAAKRAANTFQSDDGVNYALDKDWPLTLLKDINFAPNKYLGVEVCDIMSDVDLGTDAGTAALAMLTEPEILHLCTEAPEEAAALLVHVTGGFHSLFNEFNQLEEKHKEASRLVSEHLKTIKILEAEAVVKKAA